MKRTHTCGELRAKNIGKQVCLQGWVNTRRDHGGVIFIDLRDRYGLTQIVFYPDKKVMFAEAEKLRREFVLEVKGKVVSRKPGMKNPKMATGDVELTVSELKILNKSVPPPIEVDDRIVAKEEMRLRYRYLDLRRPIMQKILQMRHVAANAAREYLSSKDFLEIQTPMLVRATPEGARDYIVPSRVHPGKFYALPQSPQLYKQILMVSGFDRYFQMPICCRDEDLRADRQPEHTQIDIEMSFPELDDLFEIGEGVLKAMFKKTINQNIKTPFLRIPYKESMEKYGIDKPDIRFKLFLHDVTEIAGKSDFGVFKDVVKAGGIVKCINPSVELSRKDIEDYTDFCTREGAKGMVWMRVTEKGLEGSTVKFFKPELQKEFIKITGAKPKSTLLFVADKIKTTNDVMSRLRLELGEKLKLYNPKEFAFCWVTDFPLFGWNEDEEKWEAEHHLFCMPKEDELKHLEDDPGNVHCTQFDLTLNGVELASGSIRINKPEIQERVMKVIGMKKEEIYHKFGFLLDSFKYGAPPHGGFALGFDRIVALMNYTNDIREVIAFPKNKAAECPMDGSPSTVDDAQLKELHIKVEAPKEKAKK
jgi:aspartyl-tRNA synthetase